MHMQLQTLDMMRTIQKIQTSERAQVWSANGPNLGTCLTPEVPSAALLSNAELVNAPWP